MRIMVVAGGTGGHFYPGLAVAKKWISGGDIVSFIVRFEDFVIPLLQREKLSFFCIAAGGFARSLHPKNIARFLRFITGFFQAFSILTKEKPDGLLVMGGYLSVAPSLAARWLRIPVVLHEQNVKPGLANRIVSRLACGVCVSFESSLSYFKGKTKVTGNPVRDIFRRLPEKEEARQRWGLDPRRPTLLVFGGSQGAHRLNELVVDTLRQISNPPFQVLHVTGEKDAAWAKKMYDSLVVQGHVVPYCHQMEVAYGAADLILCRSGASTVSELISVQKPAILVPYPFATGQHQLFNARVLEEVGAATVVEEKDLTPQKLKELILNCLSAGTKLKEMEQGYSKLSIDGFHASEEIRAFSEEVIQSKCKS